MTAPFSHDAPGTSAMSWRSAPRWAEIGRLNQFGKPPINLLDDIERVVIVAAHPDDETLGTGGLCQRAQDAGIRLEVVVATDGRHSHPDSPTMSPDELGRVRRAESTHALSEVAPDAHLHFLGLTDGAVAETEDSVISTLVDLIGDGRHTLLVATWRHDGHPDHEAVGRAAATAAYRTSARLLEYPIWLWHWGDQDSAPWDDLRLLSLSDDQVTAKRQAMAAHHSQVAPLSPAPGDETLLSPAFLAHFESNEETYIQQPVEDTALDDVHAETSDPWGVDSRWYEQRKRDLLLAMLPRERFTHGLEVGCSTGALAADLAERCDRLTAVDRSGTALRAARARLDPVDLVDVHEVDVTREWPAGTFDLVVVSEVGYFLSHLGVERLADQVNSCLGAAAVVVLAHWKHEIDGWPLDGPAVHEILTGRLELPIAAKYADRDVEILAFAVPDVLPSPHR